MQSGPQNSRRQNQVFVIEDSSGKIDNLTPNTAQREGASPGGGNFTIFTHKKGHQQNFFQKPSEPNSSVVQKIFYTNPDNISSHNDHSAGLSQQDVVGNKIEQKRSTTTNNDLNDSQKSVYQMWVSSNPVFNNKYSSGATPARKSKGSNRRGVTCIREESLKNGNEDCPIEQIQMKKSQSAIIKKAGLNEAMNQSSIHKNPFHPLPPHLVDQYRNENAPDDADQMAKTLTPKARQDQNVI